MRRYNGRLRVETVCPQCGVGKNLSAESLKKIMKNKKIKRKCHHCENEYSVKF